ncbi:MAG: N-6 DNA methylase [Pseudomonadota bacterium]
MASGELTRTSVTTGDIVAKLWNMCHVLRDDGVTYNEYVTELTYLLFLKMLAETGHEERLPKDYRWGELARRTGMDQLTYYRQLMLDLGNPEETTDQTVLAIFSDAQTKLRKPTNLKSLTTDIDQLDWFSAREEGLGNLYEGLLEKNASEKKSGAGQYFTPRPLIDCIVRLMKPKAGEVIQDPAAGTGGFIVAADRYIKDATDDLFKLPKDKAHFQRYSAYTGAELVPDTHRLLLMNLMLHGIESPIESGDALSPTGEELGKADLILSNPPFGNKKGGGRPTRSDFSITADVANKQLAFVEHIVRALKPGGRAAVVVPDNVLFEDNAGRRLRTWMMDLCDLHTILRLPTGIFYAQGVKTNVLFFTRGKNDAANTKAVWIYDLRADMPAFGKTRPLKVDDFENFEKAFGADPHGTSKRSDQGEEGRFRRFARKEIDKRNGNLDIAWLRDTEAESEEGLSEPVDIAAAIMGHLRAALGEIEELSEELESDDEEALFQTQAVAE